ncbi:hypothetical protein L1987_54950 [Smallanthus sonchifolius]|uniref:Uncharacterized protein n=1 Tax=Smallanthus sonchifolius TaxID=185202 RepID=A0ACB9E8Y5_9ASTR|nr:hypothetical protein L1987_54950 [Smallanthus sonchifolius]
MRSDRYRRRTLTLLTMALNLNTSHVVGKPNKNALKVLIAAEYVGVEVKCLKNFEMGVSNKTPEFLKMNPLGKVPVLETPDGVVFESNAIARYVNHVSCGILFAAVARLKTDTTCSLFGSPPIEYGQIEQWIDFASLEIDLNLLAWLRLRFGLDNYVAAVEEVSIAVLKRALSALLLHIISCFLMLKGFWEMFDPEGYSLWFCNYKYNDENTDSFVTMNKVGGFLQRMDLARKYAFGKMLIIGNEPPFKVKGLWLFRGLDIPKFAMDECYDMELYEWTKVDLSDEIQKECVNQMIEDHEHFEGEALLDAKCFK